jgi:hypothetical protein
VPVELPECGHVFRDHCIANVVESEFRNNNTCPLCQREMFLQKDFDEDGERINEDDLEDALSDDEVLADESEQENEEEGEGGDADVEDDKSDGEEEETGHFARQSQGRTDEEEETEVLPTIRH